MPDDTRGSKRLAEERLARLLDPLEPEVFFERYYQREPAHLAGSPERARGIVDHQQIVDAIVRGGGSSGRIDVFTEHLRPAAVPTAAFVAAHARSVEPGTEPWWAYLEAGHPVIWNAARGVSEALDALCESLSEALSAHVWPNLYATGTAGTPLDIHFDTHEVLALQCEGEKEWALSSVRVDRPLDRPALRPSVEHALVSRRDEALAKTAMTFVARPGDVVYVPRGQFHNARTPRGRSLHVTFGIEHLSGMDVLDALVDLAVGESVFREYLVPEPCDEGGAMRAGQLDALRARIAGIARSDALGRALDDLALLRRRAGSRPR